MLLSIIARGMRFFLLAFLLNRYGAQARDIIEKRLGLWVTLGVGGARRRHSCCGILVLGVPQFLIFATLRRADLDGLLIGDGAANR